MINKDDSSGWPRVTRSAKCTLSRVCSASLPKTQVPMSRLPSDPVPFASA